MDMFDGFGSESVSDAHLHAADYSDALDFDGDGFSDAVESRFATDPFDPHSHPSLSGQGQLDTDGDGFPDLLERQFDANPFDAFAHPDAVGAYHWHTGADSTHLVNPAGRVDVSLGDVIGGSTASGIAADPFTASVLSAFDAALQGFSMTNG